MKIGRPPAKVGLLGLLLVANMLLAGCTSFVDDAGEEAKDKPDELKDDSTIISRSGGAPELIGFEN